MGDVISCFLEFELPDNQTESPTKVIGQNKETKKRIKDDIFQLKMTGNVSDSLPSTFSIEIQIPPQKTLSIIDKDGFPQKMSNYRITRTNVKKTSLNIDYLDFDNIVPSITIPKPTPTPSRNPVYNPDSYLKGVQKICII